MTQEDIGLLNLLKSRNPKSIQVEFDTYGKSIHGLIYRIIGSIGTKEDIEECVSDVIVEVWNNYQGYDPKRGVF